MATYVSKHTGAQIDTAVDQVGVLDGKVTTLSEEIAGLKGEVVTRIGTVVSITAEGGEKVTVSGDDEGEVTVVCQGKNFFPEFPAYNKYGLVGTQNADGSYTISGTYTGTSKAYIAPIANTTPRYLPAGTYTASSSLVEGSGVNRPVIGWTGNASQKQSFWAGSPQQFTLDEPVTFYCFIEILPGAVVDATFWAQLERGTRNTEYEVHRRTEVTGVLPVDITCDEGDNLLYCESGNAITASITRNITGLIADKLDKNLGQENYHSVLTVGETGDVVPLPNPLTGKRIAFLGDSITTTYYAHNYWQMIAEKTGCVPLGYGKSKSRIATVEGDDVESFVTRAATMDTTADAVFVMGGTNDCQLKSKLGTWDSTDASTFYGGLNALITLLRTNYPGKPIVFATPIKRKADTDNGFPDTMADLKTASADEDITMQHCVLAIKAKCARHGIPVVDLAEHSGIGAESAEYYGVNDSLHPSELGYVRIANMVHAELEKQFRHTMA